MCGIYGSTRIYKDEIIKSKLQRMKFRGPDNSEFELLNKKISDSNLPEDIRIGAIVRKDQVIIPRSNFIFEKDDLVVFLAKREQLKEVESIFSVSSI